MMGRPWLPYQQFIADVAGEKLDPFRYAYHTIVVTAPRQTAKTTTAYDSMMGRGRRYPDFRCRYTTHQGTITTAKFGEWLEEFEGSALAPTGKLRRSQGTEGIRWRPTRSYFLAFPPRDGALRSQALDGVVVDEAQEHDDLLGAALRRTIRPVFTTRPRGQLWIVFTAGHDASTYARSYLDAALTGTPGVALFDYGCPDDVDPLQESLWPLWHPGLAYGLTDTDTLRIARDEDPEAFIREYGNRWTRTQHPSVIDPADWAAVQTGLPDRPPGPYCFSLEVAADRSAASIAVATRGGWLELVERRPGTDWLLDRALQLQAEHGAPFAVDRYGASGPVVDALEVAGADLLLMRTGDVANAAAGIVDMIAQRRLQVATSAALTDAVEGAVQRHLSDGGGFVWSLTHAAAPADPLRAVSNALWGAAHLPPPPVRPAAFAL